MTGTGVAARRGKRWISHWDPEDPAFWNGGGSRIARRNLAASIFAEHLGFSVWSLWPVLVLFMTPASGYGLGPGQKFLLVSLVTLGRGNFSSSMSNINYFFPQRRKGWALGLNAGAATSASRLSSSPAWR